MSKHGLYGPKIGAAFKQMCSKRVAECVRRYSFFDSGGFGKLSHYIKYHYTCQMSTAHVEKQIIFFAGLCSLAALCTFFEIKVYLLNCLRAHGHHTLLRAFSGNYHIAFIEKNTPPLKRA